MALLESIADKVPTMRVARGLIITDSDELVLVRRIPKPGESSGKLELPGGKYESGDDFAAALRREAGEEIGVEVAPFGAAQAVECRVLEKRSKSPYSGFKLTFAGRAAITGGLLVPQPEEVSEILQVHIPDIEQVVHELTRPTLNALGLYGLYGFSEPELPRLAA